MLLSHCGNIILYLAQSLPGSSLESEVSIFNRNGLYLGRQNVWVTLKKCLYVMGGKWKRWNYSFFVLSWVKISLPSVFFNSVKQDLLAQTLHLMGLFARLDSRLWPKRMPLNPDDWKQLKHASCCLPHWLKTSSRHHENWLNLSLKTLCWGDHLSLAHPWAWH